MEYVKLIQELDKGRVAEALNDRLEELVKMVGERNKPGSLVVKISITPDGPSLVSVGCDAEVKLPKQAMRSTILYHDPKKPGELATDDPAQLAMEFNRLPEPEVRRLNQEGKV